MSNGATNGVLVLPETFSVGPIDSDLVNDFPQVVWQGIGEVKATFEFTMPDAQTAEWAAVVHNYLQPNPTAIPDIVPFKQWEPAGWREPDFKPHLSSTALMDAVWSVVEEAGLDYQYDRHDGWAQYVRAGQPDCLFGRVLHRLGVPVRDLARFEGQRIELPVLMHYIPDQRMLGPLSDAQRMQDSGFPWGVVADRLSRDLGYVRGAR